MLMLASHLGASAREGGRLGNRESEPAEQSSAVRVVLMCCAVMQVDLWKGARGGGGERGREKRREDGKDWG